MAKIFTIKNISEFSNFMNEIETSAKSCDGEYDCERLCIVGDNAAEYAEKHFGFTRPTHSYRNELKGSAKDAEIKNIYYAEWYYDARSDTHGFSTVFKRQCVCYKGEFLEPIFGNRATSAWFSFVFDMRTYHEKITNSWKNGHPEPNKVGTLTDKKLADWYEYLTARREEYDRVVRAENDTINQFLTQVRELAPQCKEARIGDVQGVLRANNLVFSYSISKGYIYKEIKVDYRGNTSLETFAKMIKGEF